MGMEETQTQCFENHGQDSRVKEIDVAPTISAKAGTGGNNLPLAVEPSASTEIMCCHGSQDPIVNEGDHANAIGRNQGAETVVAQLKMPQMTVRRLLPLETELLMAMPPNHTIPSFKPEDITDELVDEFIEIFYNWDMMNRKPKKSNDTPKNDECDIDDADGETIEDASDDAAETAEEAVGQNTEEIADELPPVKRRSRKVVRAWLEKISNPKTCPDAPRYKACGNGFCCNVIRWIGLSIQAVEDKYNPQNAQ